MNKQSLSYIAGIVDGEGYIGANKRKQKAHYGYQPRCSVAMVDPEAIDYLHEQLGGNRYIQYRAGCRPLHTVEWSALQAEKVCKILLPFLKVKKYQAELLIALSKLRKVNHNVGRLKVTNYSDQQSIYDELRIAKKGNITKGFKIPKPKSVVRPIRHSTRFGYQQGCRCIDCKKANADHSKVIRGTYED